jgi:dTDP-4-amino-4,6-dideoxygalactose transaminase
MPQWTVPLSDLVVAEDDIAVIADVYRSGWLSMGPETEAFEREFAAYTGTRHALAVANGTAALHLICAAAGLGPGDEAVVPSMTFVATVNAVAYTGATPVFADIAGLAEPWLDPAAAAAAITPRTKAIVNMTYGGHPGATEALHALAEERGLVLLEDVAHAIGSWLGDRHLGTFGTAAAFSFFANKNLAVGEGGMVVTDDDDVAARMRLLRSHGMTTLTWDRHRGHAAGYDVVDLGFNYRIDEPRSALARRRLSRLDAENAARAELDARRRPRDDARPRRGRPPRAPPVHGRARRGRRPGGLPRPARRGRDPDQRPLPARPRVRDLRRRSRAAADRGLRAARGHVADVRDDDHRPAGRGRRGRPRGAGRRARLTGRARGHSR